MKRIVLMVTACLVLLSGCTSAGAVAQELEQVPEDAEMLMIYNATSGSGVTGQGVTLDSFEVVGTGYLVLQTEYESGTLKDLSIRRNSPDNDTVMTVSDGMRSGVYRSPSGTFSEGETCVVAFGTAKDLKVRFTVWFVEE